MLLDRNYLINKFGANLTEKTDLNLGCPVLSSIPNFNEIKRNILVDLKDRINDQIWNLFPFLSIISEIKEPITKIDSNAFKGLNKLEIIDLTNNQIKQLNGNVFDGLCSLHRLCLENCQIVEIDINTFYGLSNLVKLDLDKNKLTYLDSNWFNGLVNLEVLYLHENKISKIYPKCFSGLKKIKFLSLCQNKVNFKSFACEKFLDTYCDLNHSQKSLICSYTFVANFDEFILQFEKTKCKI